MSQRVVSLSLGEVILKGKNRKSFIDTLMGQVKKSLHDISHGKIYQDTGKIYIDCNKEDQEKIIKRAQHIFGIVYLSPCIKIEKNLPSIEEGIREITRETLEENPEFKTFKGDTKRADKNFELNSMELNNIIGGQVLKNFPIKVDVHNPDFYIYMDIRREVYLYTKRFKGHGGLPLGTNGKGLLLLSGGIDSPVAGYMMAKRGVKIDGLHFHSFPFTSQRAEEKVVKLGEIISTYGGPMKIYSINLLQIQKEINKNCREDEMTLLSRRFMMRIAERISEKNGYNSIITGENLGQVASQTIDGLTVTNDITRRLIFRPLIGMDKVDIIDISKKIGTYETSILPFEDCCTVFLPKHPKLRPTIKEMEISEEKLDIESLVEDALNNAKIIEIS